MRYGELRRELERGKTRRIYLLFGDEPYLMAEACSLVVQTCTLQQGGASDLWTAWAAEVDAGRLAEALTTAGGLLGQRIVVLRSLEEGPPDVVNTLVRTIPAVPPSVTVVMTLKAKLPTALANAVRSVGAEAGGLVEFVEPPPARLPSWLVERARKGGVNLGRAAAAELVSTVGTSITRLMSELEKLREYAESASHEEITVEDVRAVVAPEAEHTIFDLLDAVGSHSSALAMSSLETLVASGEPAARIVFMLARHVRNMALASGMSSRGATTKQMATRLGTPDFLVGRYLAQARNWTEDSLGRAIVRLHKADRQVKGEPGAGPQSERVILELLVNDLLSCR